MIQTLGPFIPGINWENKYLGQVTTRYLLPVTHLRSRLYVETLFGVQGFSRPERQRFINLRPIEGYLA